MLLSILGAAIIYVVQKYMGHTLVFMWNSVIR